MGCGSSDLSNMSDTSSEIDEINDPPLKSTVSLSIEKKTIEDNMIPTVQAHSKTLTNLLFDSVTKWNHSMCQTELLTNQIMDMLTTYLLQHKYYTVEFDRGIYSYKPIITPTEICTILPHLNNYGGLICNASSSTCSCLLGICSLLNIHLNLTTNSIREYSHTYVNPKLKCSSDHTVQINLIKLKQPQPNQI